ncbi:MAG: SIMPL domain-containing protein [Bacteroidia bacterium]|nr:SIMPL domain-containing protein [Bacteroidia bacterium]
MKSIIYLSLLIFFVGCTTNTDKEGTSINVTGTSNLSIDPDIVEVQLSVSYSSVNRDSVLSKVNGTIKALLNDIKSCKTKPVSIFTGNYNVSYYKEYQTKTYKYHGDQIIELKTKLVIADVEEIIGIVRKYTLVDIAVDYALSNKLRDSVANKLRVLALKDAEEKSSFLARSSSLRIQKIINISYGSTGYGGGAGAASKYEMLNENANSSTPINMIPKPINLSDEVLVSYQATKE